MQENRKPRGNLGEWSELLTLAKLLIYGGGFSADSHQNKDESNFNKVLQVIIAGDASEPETIFQISEENIEILRNEDLVKIVSKADLKSLAEEFFNELTSGKNKRTFPLESGSSLMKLLDRKSISAKSNETITDLELVIEDPVTHTPQPRSGYSIKSQLGQTSTLLNASGATNLIYKIFCSNSNLVPVLQGTSHRKNIQSLYEQGFELIFDSYQKDTFRKNISYIDSQLPSNLPKVILQHYLTNETTGYASTIEMVFPPHEQENEQVIYKFKQLLLGISMGLRPAKEWKGNLEKYKGLLIVNRQGDILFYPQGTKLNFQDFLYRNVRFDRPASRLKYGSIYKEKDDYFIKLNFQIRFK